MTLVTIKILKVHHDSFIPEIQTKGAAGYDLHAYCPDGIDISAMDIILVPTGIKIEIPEGYDVEIRPRSGLSTKNKLLVPNSPGTIDCDYRGEIFVPIMNLGKESFRISHGLRIAQMLIRKTFHIEWKEVIEFETATSREDKGFGSTG